MIQKINNSNFRGNGPIRIFYPGLFNGKNDSGIGSIGRIDYASFQGSHTIPMHPHVNDEILSYFRSGKIVHTDSEGHNETINANKLMLMKAGKIFYHEEKMIDTGVPMEGFQIFIRPSQKDLKPAVIFQDLNEVHSNNSWRLLASPLEESKLKFSSQTWIYDVRLDKQHCITLPELPKKELTLLLIVFKGSVVVNNNFHLNGQDSLLINGDEKLSLVTNSFAELVLFVTYENGEIYYAGMYSGNKM